MVHNRKSASTGTGIREQRDKTARRRLALAACSVIAVGVVMSIWVAHVKAASATLTFAFTRIVELNCDEGPGESCPNDYYPKVEIGGQGLEDGKDQFCCAHGTDIQISDWVFTRTVDPANKVPVHVELWDQDDLSGDDQIDIANGPSSLDLLVDLNNCTWSGGGLKGVLNGQFSSQGEGADSSKSTSPSHPLRPDVGTAMATVSSTTGKRTATTTTATASPT
jgi:hypothetical protein